MSIFKTKGFDSIIGKNLTVTGDMDLQGTVVIDGTFNGGKILSADSKTGVLVVNGTVNVETVVLTSELTITGTVTAREVRVEGTLALKSKCMLKADKIYYRNLVVEPGAVILGEMLHLDHLMEPA